VVQKISFHTLGSIILRFHNTSFKLNCLIDTEDFPSSSLSFAGTARAPAPDASVEDCSGTEGFKAEDSSLQDTSADENSIGDFSAADTSLQGHCGSQSTLYRSTI